MKKFSILFQLFNFTDGFTYIILYIFNRNSSRFKLLDQAFKLLDSLMLTGFHLKSKLWSTQYSLTQQNLTFSLRKSSSDLQVFEQVLFREEYKDAMALIHKKIKLNHHPVIVDAGANIGCSGIYISHFPKFEMSRLVAIEPFPNTYNLMVKNLNRNLKQFNSCQAALWSKNATLNFDLGFRDGKAWSVRTVEDSNGNVQAITLKQLMVKFNIQTIDVLKIDIEGSEFDVFLHSHENIESLKMVSSVIMEIHDDAGDRNKLYEIFNENGFEIIDLGELTLFMNNRFKKSNECEK